MSMFSIFSVSSIVSFSDYQQNSPYTTAIATLYRSLKIIFSFFLKISQFFFSKSYSFSLSLKSDIFCRRCSVLPPSEKNSKKKKKKIEGEETKKIDCFVFLLILPFVKSKKMKMGCHLSSYGMFTCSKYMVYIGYYILPKNWVLLKSNSNIQNSKN